MPGQIRPDQKLAKIQYKILQTPKDQQQHKTKEPTERQRRAWELTSRLAGS